LFGFFGNTAIVFFFLLLEQDFRLELLRINLEPLVASAVFISVRQGILLGRLHLGQLRVEELLKLVVALLHITAPINGKKAYMRSDIFLIYY
jgi:hypothetical protein